MILANLDLIWILTPGWPHTLKPCTQQTFHHWSHLPAAFPWFTAQRKQLASGPMAMCCYWSLHAMQGCISDSMLIESEVNMKSLQVASLQCCAFLCSLNLKQYDKHFNNGWLRCLWWWQIQCQSMIHDPWIHVPNVTTQLLQTQGCTAGGKSGQNCNPKVQGNSKMCWSKQFQSCSQPAEITMKNHLQHS